MSEGVEENVAEDAVAREDVDGVDGGDDSGVDGILLLDIRLLPAKQ